MTYAILGKSSVASEGGVDNRRVRTERERGAGMNGWAAVLPLVGVVIGATMQYWLSRSAESRKQLQFLQSQSYVDYLRTVTKAAHAVSPEAARSAKAEAADAKARLAVYGTPSVIAALARFEEAGAIIDSNDAEAVFIAIVGAMRNKADAAPADDLKLVLFGR